LNIGFESYCEADLLERILEFALIVVVTLNGIRGGRHTLTLRTEVLPKFSVIKLATIGLARGVINVLYIDKNGNFFRFYHNGGLLEATRCKVELQ